MYVRVVRTNYDRRIIVDDIVVDNDNEELELSGMESAPAFASQSVECCHNTCNAEMPAVAEIHVFEQKDEQCHFRELNYCIPKFTLFNGLFAGTISDELIGLTVVEESMMNFFSSIAKMFLAGGKDYRMKSGMSYAIINYLTSVAKH